MNRPRQSDLWGSWQLLDWTLHYPSRSVTSRPFGGAPQGLLIYESGGWMSVALRGQGGDPPESRQVSYAGRWWLDGEYVIHALEFAWRADWVAIEQRRRVTLAGANDLRLEANEVDDRGRQRVHHLQWRRHPVGDLRTT